MHEHDERPFKDKVTVRFVRRPDGGLRALCDAIPGFYLSGQNPRDVISDVVPAIEALMRHNLGIEVAVFPLQHAVYELRERVPAGDADAIPEERDYVIERRAAA
jgi:hypothetical protein